MEKMNDELGIMRAESLPFVRTITHYRQGTFLTFFFFCLVLFSFSSKAQVQLSPQAKVSLITVGPGDELYSSFGHSALWIYDPVYQLDRAYSYGTFSFETGNFYIKFLRGTLPYTISVNPLMPQFYYWQQENRSVKEQELNLSTRQKQRLFDYLETNLLPQNREYQYKFFYDNCSTRLGDALKAAAGDSLTFPGYTRDTLSFRQWIDRYAYVQKPWADFGMDLAIGSPSDEIATPQQATFLPDNLSAAFSDARVKAGNQEVPLVMETRELYTATPEADHGWLTPKLFFWALAILIAAFTVWQIQQNKLNFTLDKILFTLVGLTGWLILLLWFGTNHGVTSWNWDILWAFPLWIPFVFSFSKTHKPAWFQWFLIAYGVLLLCATANLLKHNYVLIPILLILIMRVYYLNNSLEKIGNVKSQG
ncbi:Lnb N-terminal periplasmic domain-containing protein [Salmonirosea aquatica]